MLTHLVRATSPASPRKRIAVIAATALAGGLTVLGTGIASASSASGQNTSAPTGAAARAATSRCTKLWAVVNANGSLARAACRGIKSSNTGGPGSYHLLFPRNVRHCAYVATLGFAGHTEVPGAGQIGVAGLESSSDGVFVVTRDASGAPLNQGFHIIVEC